MAPGIVGARASYKYITLLLSVAILLLAQGSIIRVYCFIEQFVILCHSVTEAAEQAFVTYQATLYSYLTISHRSQTSFHELRVHRAGRNNQEEREFRNGLSGHHLH